MPDTTDLWYIRLPDGRVLRAAGTAVVRQHLTAGRLPPGTRLRRSPDEEWRLIDRFSELADLAPASTANGVVPDEPVPWRAAPSREAPATIASRLDATLLHLPGVRGLVEELLAALDSALVKPKLVPAGLVGLFLGALAALAGLPWFDFATWPPGPGWLLPVAAFVAWSWLAVVLSRLTYVEVTRLRPARLKDGLAGCAGPTARLLLAQAVPALLLGGLVVVLRWLPGWLPGLGSEHPAAAFQVAAVVSAVAGPVLEVLLWPLLVLLLPLAALLVVEECSFVSALRQWCRLVRNQLGKLLLAEMLALGVGLLLAAPLALLAFALGTRPSEPEHALAVESTCRVLYGLLGSVVLAYLVVANVFIYLNLRYER